MYYRNDWIYVGYIANKTNIWRDEFSHHPVASTVTAMSSCQVNVNCQNEEIHCVSFEVCALLRIDKLLNSNLKERGQLMLVFSIDVLANTRRRWSLSARRLKMLATTDANNPLDRMRGHESFHVEKTFGGPICGALLPIFNFHTVLRWISVAFVCQESEFIMGPQYGGPGPRLCHLNYWDISAVLLG